MAQIDNFFSMFVLVVTNETTFTEDNFLCVTGTLRGKNDVKLTTDD